MKCYKSLGWAVVIIVVAVGGAALSAFSSAHAADRPAAATRDAASLATAASATVNPVTVMLGGKALPPASVTYAGVTPGMTAGLYQINVTLPAGIPAGDTSLKLMVNGAASQEGVTILTVAQ